MPWKSVRIKVRGGKATPEPPLGPSISQYGLNVDEVVNKINEVTKVYEGLEVTVDIHVNTDTKEYRIEVKSPSTTSLLLSMAGADKPSGDPAHTKVGNISLEDAIKVAIMKKRDLNAKTLKAALKSIVSSAATIGLTVEKKDPYQVVKEIAEGVYDDLIKKYESSWNEV